MYTVTLTRVTDDDDDITCEVLANLDVISYSNRLSHHVACVQYVSLLSCMLTGPTTNRVMGKNQV